MIQFAHVGLPKSASTWLQTGLFSHHPDLGVISKVYEKHQQPSHLLKCFWSYAAGKSNDASYDTDYWRSEFSSLIENHFSGKKVMGISEEEFSNGGFVHYIPTLLPTLREVFGPIKILIILRHPMEYLRSVYSQYIKIGGTYSVGQFYNPDICNHLEKRIDYRLLIQDAQRLFGNKNVCILPFEMLIHEGEQAFVNEICMFLDVPTIPTSYFLDVHRNPSINRKSLPLYIFANNVDLLLTRLMSSDDRFRQGMLNKLLTRILRRVPFDKNSSPIAFPELDHLSRIPNYRAILREENFCFWVDEKEHYNYTFENYLLH